MQKDYQEQIKGLLSEMRDCAQLVDADEIFLRASQIHMEMMKKFMRGEIKADDFIKSFLADFDRIDDSEARNKIFNNVKNGKITKLYFEHD